MLTMGWTMLRRSDRMWGTAAGRAPHLLYSSQAGPSYENTDHGYDVTMTHGVMGVNVILRICGKNA